MNFYVQSFLIFSRIGLFTIGGGYAMVPLIEAEVVEKKQWITKEEFLDLMALAQTAPGIFAVNIAIFIGYKLHKFWGAFWMTLGTILPSFIIMLLIALFFQQIKSYEVVEHIFQGIRPAVVALIAAPCLKMARSARINAAPRARRVLSAAAPDLPRPVTSIFLPMKYSLSIFHL